MSMVSEIELLIRSFISGEDTSISAANKIELALDDHFPNDDYVQQTVEILAMYRPGGGEFLFDLQEVKKRLMETENYIRKIRIQ